MAFSTAAASGTLVKVAYRIVMDTIGIGLTEADWILTLKGVLGADPIFNELERLWDEVDERCTDSLTRNLKKGVIENLVTRVIMAKITSVGMSVVAAGLGPGTFGVGTIAIFVAERIVDHFLEKDIEDRIKELKESIETDCPIEDTPEYEFDQGDQVVADPVWLRDPSGYVYEVSEDNRLEGVTAQLLQQNPSTGDWLPWDAQWFEQENPLITDAEGKYAWDVPEGNWMVAYEKDGYEMAYSEELPVPPPQLDVNIGLVSLSPPDVASVTAAAGGTTIDIVFNKYVQSSTITTNTVFITPTGDPSQYVSGNLTTISAVVYNASPVSKSFRFTPQVALTVGANYTIQVNQLVQSYAGTPMAADFETTIVIAAVPEPPSPPPPSGGGGGGGGGAPGGPGVTAITPYTNSEGLFNLSAVIKSEDGKVRLTIERGVLAKKSDGQPLKSISIVPVEDPPDLPEFTEFVGLPYDLGPDGAAFSPDISLAFNYDLVSIPEGVAEKDLKLGYYDETSGKWVILEAKDISIDTLNHTITIKINHFTTYTIVASTRPASFTLSNIIVTPAEASLGKTVNISVDIANSGDLSGNYEVVLKIDGNVEGKQTVTVAGHTSTKASFSISTIAAGSHTVEIGKFSANILVKAPDTAVPTTKPAITTPAPTTPPSQAPGKGGVAVWVWILIAVVALAIIGFLVWRFGIRKKPGSVNH